jgi:hypothetical protein
VQAGAEKAVADEAEGLAQAQAPEGSGSDDAAAEASDGAAPEDGEAAPAEAEAAPESAQD